MVEACAELKSISTAREHKADIAQMLPGSILARASLDRRNNGAGGRQETHVELDLATHADFRGSIPVAGLQRVVLPKPTRLLPAPTTSIAATASSRVFPRLRLVDRQAAAAMFVLMEGVDCRQCLRIASHLDEAEATAPTGLSVYNDLCVSHLAKRGE